MNAKPFWIHEVAASAFDPVLSALQGSLSRGLDRHAEAVIETAEAEHSEAQFRREIVRLHSLPRATQPNPLDSCHDCGGEAQHVTYRDGRAIGLCDECAS